MNVDWTDVPVLVTGASGFIGTAVCNQLRLAGADLHTSQHRNATPASKMHKLDLTDIPSCVALLKNEGIEKIIHLAAHVDAGRHGGFDTGPFLHNLNMAKSVGEAARQADVNSLVVAGSSDEYGVNSAPLVESTREMPISPYSASKVAATHWLQMMHRVNGLPVIVARPFLTYGPGDKSNRLIPSLIRSCLAGEPFAMTDGRQQREFNFVADMATMFIGLAGSATAIGRVVNLGNGVAIPVHKIAEKIVAKVGRGQLQLGALPRRDGETETVVADIAMATELLGHLPSTPLDEGLAATITWMSN